MVRVGDLVKINALAGEIAIVIGVTTTAYGWQTVWVQHNNKITRTSTLQVELLENEHRGYGEGSIREHKKP